MLRKFWIMILIAGMVFIPGLFADSMNGKPDKPPVDNFRAQICKPGENCPDISQYHFANYDNPQETEKILLILEEHGINTWELREAIRMHNMKKIEEFIMQYQYILQSGPKLGDGISGFQTGPGNYRQPTPLTYNPQNPVIVAGCV